MSKKKCIKKMSSLRQVEKNYSPHFLQVSKHQLEKPGGKLHRDYKRHSSELNTRNLPHFIIINSRQIGGINLARTFVFCAQRISMAMHILLFVQNLFFKLIIFRKRTCSQSPSQNSIVQRPPKFRFPFQMVLLLKLTRR